MHLHISAGTEPDVHLLAARESCSLHRSCEMSGRAFAPKDGIRVVVAAMDGVRVEGLADPLVRDDTIFVIGHPLETSEISGNAVALSIDRSLLPASLAEAEKRLARVSVQELSRFLCGLIGQLGQLAAAAPRIPPSSTQGMARAILSVLSSIYLEEIARGSIQVPRTHSGNLHAQAIAVIRDRITDPELSPSLIAEACAVTPRYLHMLFEKRGETISTRILSERLERCRGDLADAALGESSISEIAARWGFNTPSHFSQKFRSRYGMTPREWRNSALREP
ncbi:helix-turn-helix domain-containing protein [Arthrobacter sulfonylureivorans]|uniref:Helix-turn-helix domain-containing protein n=1 Tax=Arthrobacter sulfonylureivorans TaxID=2486855 RepID=A0ABY3WEA0_9MICC|nr:helix-turn-helix domain-containing protein [Arthrobacter sulfonylureivorans]UNK47752.1 helix-turn-helix domain-containing protein [Arthrobacter sulfonylureivorans]